MGSEGAEPVRRFELGTDGPSCILVGVDGSQTSMHALAYAVGLARRQHSRLVAVFVRTPARGMFTVTDRTGVVLEAHLEAQDEIETELRGLFCRSTEWGVEAELVVTDGDPLSRLSNIAEQKRADAVIVGASTALGHRLAGSLAVRLVRSRRWPITVVP